MRKLVFCFVMFAAWACGSADDTQHSETESQETFQEVMYETAPQQPMGEGIQAQGFYEWTNRSSLTCGSWQYFAINVPQNTPNLTVYSQYGTAYEYGAQLYVRSVYKPTTTTYSGASLNHGTNEEFVSIDNPIPGTWWIGIYAYCGYTGVTVGAVY